ncbi:Protein CBG01280 [Caenorhabditis briggsae]|uniref:Protein CBG01280 n=1 Tax=Caenorhabditis briggsae TaxID=6238 RepID=A8WQ13_CAEBR|nr:Protein CBG01280 [Caenorhabditis briggsae]CAP22571.2 Protein CBG01280 [Caenorhabditis briggsae]
MKDFSPIHAFLSGHCYQLSVVFHFIISCNRFCAVWMPLKYSSVFSIKNTCWMISVNWIILGAVNRYFFVYVCPMKYDPQRRILAYDDTDLCDNIVWYGDFVKNSIVVCIFMIIDIMTVIKVRKVRLFSVNNKNKNNESISERERRFLKQTVSQGIVFMVELITWFSIDKITSNKVVIFLLSGYAFTLVHVLDGIIVLMFNPEIRSFLGCTKNKPIRNQVNISVNTTV